MIIFGLLFVGLSSLLGCAGALLVGHLTPTIGGISLVAGFAVSIYLMRNWKLEFKPKPVSWPVFLLYLVIGAGIYFHSIYTFYYKDGYYWIQNPFDLGDMSFHWGVIRYIAKGAHFWPENPIYLGFRFKYPFGMDFFNALWENLGVAISTHLTLVTLSMLALTFYVLHVVGGPILVFAVFFSCGFYKITEMNSSNVFQIQDNLDFKNLFLTVLLSQRGFLYAMPAGVFLYGALRKYFAKEWQPTPIEKVSLGIVWGSLGFFHLHTFFFASMFLGLLILYKKDLKNWLLPIAIASVLGFPFVINALVPEVGTSSLMHFNARGWGRQADVNYFIYWGKNLGPWILAMITAIICFYRKKNWSLLVPTALAFACFFLFSHLILAPWDWDNVKLILWCYIFGMMTISDLLWNQRNKYIKFAVFILFFTPGLLVFVQSTPVFNHGIQWVSEKEINKTEVVLHDRDVNGGLIITPNYDHPALILGYKLYMGFTGHVWSHGYSYGPREAIVNRIYDGDDTAVNEIPANQVKWIYSGTAERVREKSGFPPKNITKVGEALDHDLYEIKAQK